MRIKGTDNRNLHAAKVAKRDEFHTQRADIEREMDAYLEHDPDVFRGKAVLLPCDDPEWSNFTRYFVDNFQRHGLRRLISTSYTPGGRGRVLDLRRGDTKDLGWGHLKGDGDFRGDEVTALRNESDMVITNPPFSLYRDFVNWLMAGDVQFSIIGNSNSVTYKEIFPLIRENRMWKGATSNHTDMVFEVPLESEVRQSDMDKADRLGYPSENGKKYTRLGNSCWFTNIDHGIRHEPLSLMAMADNLTYSRRKKIREEGYPEYDNYDAIEVAFTEAIPSGYEGVMGVPISFLDKYNPGQFEIVPIKSKKTGDLLAPGADGWHVNGKRKYARIFIRHRNPQK